MCSVPGVSTRLGGCGPGRDWAGIQVTQTYCPPKSLSAAPEGSIPLGSGDPREKNPGETPGGEPQR